MHGTLHKKDKTKLMHKLEEKVTSDNPFTSEVYAVDAMYFLHSQIQAPKTFGELAKSILTKLLALVERIDVVRDTYTSPSINNVESNICGSQNDRFLLKITDAEQICPKDFQEAMKSCNVKSSLLAHEWRNQAYFDIIKGHLYSVCWD